MTTAARFWRAISLFARRSRIEGVSGTAARLRGLVAERRRSRAFVSAPADWSPRAPIRALQIFPTFPSTPFGGVEVQLRARLDAEDRPWALLRRTSREDWKLEVDSAGERVAVHFAAPPAGELDLESSEWEELIDEAAVRTGSLILHFESAVGFPLGSLLHLAERWPVVLSIHDFGLFCARPHLYSAELGAFCRYSTDLEICGRCLRRDWPDAPADAQARRRAAVPPLLDACARVVFPSEFLRRQHEALFGPGATRRAVVIPPLSLEMATEPRPARPIRTIAFLGGGHAHKGAACFEQLVVRTKDLGLRFLVYGGDPLEDLARLRRLPDVRIRGTYLPGELGRRLRRDEVDLALLLSEVPESYSLTLDECVLAGVPVLARAHGALTERVVELEAGWLVAPTEGPEGVVKALTSLLKHHCLEVSEAAVRRVAELMRSAREQCRRLYDGLD